MIEAQRQPGAGRPTFSTLKRIVPWLFLAMVLLFVGSLYTKYRTNMDEWQAAQVKSASAIQASQDIRVVKKPKPKPSSVMVLTDVTFRSDADFSSDVIRDLSAGEKLTFVAQAGQWFKVKDSSGKVGFVTAAAKYTKLVNK